MKNLKDQLAGIAALIAAIIAIGGGFVKYGEVMTKIDVLEGASKGIDMSFLSEIKVLEEKRNKINNVSCSFCTAKWLQTTLLLQNGYNHS